MTKSVWGDFIFLTFILVLTQIVSNYAFEERLLALLDLLTLKKCLSLLIGVVTATAVMYFIKRSKFMKSLDKK